MPAQAVERLDEAKCAAEEPELARDPGRRDDGEPPNAFRPRRGDLGRDETAERVADEVDVVERGGVEPTAEPRGQCVGALPFVEARQVDEEDGAPLSEEGPELRPPA